METTRAVRRRVAAVVVAAAGAMLAVVGALPECSSSGGRITADSGATDVASHDVRLERLTSDDSSAGGDALLLCDAGAGAASWPGWQPQSHVSALSPCCPWGTPVEAAASMPPYAWVPCANGAPSCMDFATSWAPAPAAFFGSGKASRDANGKPKWLMFTRGIGPYETPPAEDDLYDIGSGTPLGAWRDGDGPTQHYCFVEALLGQTNVTINAQLSSQGLYVANGSPPPMMDDPPLQQYSNTRLGFQERLASDRVFAFDIEPQGIIARTDFGSGTLQQAKGNVGLLLSMVEGDDVFAYSEQGDAGWGQLYVVDASGTLALLRANPSAHVATPASDGTRIYWTETYGSTNVLQPQTRLEFWSAPYTADPAALAGTGAKVAEVQNPQLPIASIAFGGLMAVLTRDNTVYVARVADGKVIQPSAGPNRGFEILIAVTPSELWAIESIPNGAPNSSLSRIGLGAW